MFANFSSGIEMLTVAAMVNTNTPSPSTDKDTRDESNHPNAPSPIQTANSPNSSLNNWEITQADPPNKTQHLNTLSSQENTDSDPMFGVHLLHNATMQHEHHSNKAQGSSDTNQPEESTTNTLNKASTIARGENKLPLNNPVSNPNKKTKRANTNTTQTSKTYVCTFVINTFTSQICGKKFTQNAILQTHYNLHTGDESFVCDICNKAYSNNYNLTIHKRTHTGDKPYLCDRCGASFTQSITLTNHQRTHTGDKPFVCVFCGNAYTRKFNFINHQRTHTEDKPFVCDICKKTCSNNYNLTIHKRTHTGDKPYLCDRCGASFTQSITLTNHQRTHTGNKPFVCVVCGNAYSRKFNLTNHIHKFHTTGKKMIPANSVEKHSHTAPP